LPATAYGVIAVALIVQLALALGGAAGLPETLARTYFQSADGPVRARALVALALATSLVVALLAELAGPAWSRALLDLPYDAPVRLAVWSSVPLAGLLTAQALLRATDRPRAFLASAVVGTAGAQALGLAFVALGDPTPTTYLFGVTVGVAVAAAIAVVASGIAVRGLADLVFVRSTLRLSVPTVAHSLGAYVIWAGNRAVVNHLEGSAAAGRFQVAFLVGGLTVLFVSAIYGAWSPIVFGVAEERRWSTLADTTDAVYRVAAIGAAATAVGAPVALVVLTPPEYEPLDLAPVSALVALSAVPFVMYCANLQVILWHGRTLALAWLTPLVAAVNVAANFALIPILGLRGAAVATVIAYVLQALALRAFAQRLRDVPWRRRAFVEACVLTVGAVAAGVVLPTGGAWLALRAAAALALAALLAGAAARMR
jgi:O-antigen/teichoic acid export membrane protein